MGRGGSVPPAGGPGTSEHKPNPTQHTHKMTTTYAAAAAANANATAAAPKWRVMTRRSFAVRGTSVAALCAAYVAGTTLDEPVDRKERRWRIRNVKYDMSMQFGWGHCPGKPTTNREVLEAAHDWMARTPLRSPFGSVDRNRRQWWFGWASSIFVLEGDIRELARAHWRIVRGPILKRAVALYWQEQTQRALYAPGGAGRKVDRAAFESEFA